MISGHEKFKMSAEGEGTRGEPFYIEVNFEGEEYCRRVKFTFPDGKSTIILKEHLNAVLFAIGNEDEQRKMIPQVERRSRWYETVVSVKTTRNIKKGENLTFPIKLSLPTFDQEVIAEAKKDVIKSTYPIIGA